MNITLDVRPYCCTLVVKDMMNKSDLQLLAYDYVQFLKKLGATDVSAVTKSNYQLAYPIKKLTNLTFIEFSFILVPKALGDLTRKIKLDELVLRSFLIKKQ